MRRRALAVAALVGWLTFGAAAARADAVETLRAFVRDVKSGRADFTQSVTATEGARPKVSSGRFEFERPNRFRFEYLKPFEQLIVADGRKVWVYDPELNQVTARPLAKAIGATPAALLAGAALEPEFTLAPEPPASGADGLDWVLATPRQREGTVQSMRIGFRGRALAAVEIRDAFGQRSLLQFAHFEANAAVSPERFRFVPPPGTDVIEQ